MLIIQKSGPPLRSPLSSASPCINIDNQIRLVRSQLPAEAVAFLKEELNFLNSEYVTKRRLGKSTYKVQKYFRLIEESGDGVTLPRGFLNTLLAFLNERAILYFVHFAYPSLDEVSYARRWKMFRRRSSLATKRSLREVLELSRAFLLPLVDAELKGTKHRRTSNRKTKTWE